MRRSGSQESSGQSPTKHRKSSALADSPERIWFRTGDKENMNNWLLMVVVVLLALIYGKLRSIDSWLEEIWLRTPLPSEEESEQ
jgi:hypothetical protein